MINSQADVERKVSAKIEKVRSGELSIFKAFEGPADELMVTIGKHSLFLNPYYERWLYYDYIHDTWKDTGLNMGEGLIVACDDTLGFKKIPPAAAKNKQVESLESWYLYLHNETLKGPLKKVELQELLMSKKLPANTPVFNAGMAGWQRADSTPGMTAKDAVSEAVSIPQLPEPFLNQTSPFEAAEVRYVEFKAAFDQGVISREAFLQNINELRFQDASGIWWQLVEDGQSWLKWNGKAWEISDPKSRNYSR